MIFNNHLVVISLAAIAAAQSSVSASASASGPLPSISPCILNCTLPAAAAAGCTSITDLACICNSTEFLQTATACLQANCTSSEVSSALGLQSSECGVVSNSTSVSALPSVSPSLSSSLSSPLFSSLFSSPSLPVSASSASISRVSPTITSVLNVPTSSAAPAAVSTSTNAPPATTNTSAASFTVANLWGVAIGLVGAAAAAVL